MAFSAARTKPSIDHVQRRPYPIGVAHVRLLIRREASKDNSRLKTSSPVTHSPARLLQTLEFAAITTAAVCQAVVLIDAAAQQLKQAQYLQQPDGLVANVGHSGDLHSIQQQDHHQHQQQHPGVQQQQQPPNEQQVYVHLQPLPPHPVQQSGLHLVTSSALLLGLMCGAGLRYLQPRLPHHGSKALNPSADAAVRLAAVEVASQQLSAQLTTAARQMDKLQARVRVATSDLKAPLKSVQGAAAQQAAALIKLSEQQATLQKQVDGSQELIAALQGLAAKQFKVSIEALQQLKHGQTQLSSSTSKALADLQKQQQSLQKHLERQQQLLRALETSAATWQQQQQQHHHTHSTNGSAGVSSHVGSSGMQAPLPDPWQAASHGSVPGPGASKQAAGSNHRSAISGGSNS